MAWNIFQIDEMYVGVALEGASQGRIRMASFPLEGWGKEVTSHERLKQSYYMLKEYWAARIAATERRVAAWAAK